MYKATLTRLQGDDKQTLGTMSIFNGLNKVFECVTLELPDKNNEKRVSRIPEGKYICVKRWSEKYKSHFHVTDVENRSYILIHAGNYNTHTKGCILLGKSFADINGDGYNDVTSSKNTMKKLNNLQIDRFELTIISV